MAQARKKFMSQLRSAQEAFDLCHYKFKTENAVGTHQTNDLIRSHRAVVGPIKVML